MFTLKLEKAWVLLDLPLLDHPIISSEGYYSFADEGLL
jgi:DNA repair protein RadC